MTYPYRHTMLRQKLRKRKNVVIVVSRKLFVLLTVNVLDVQHNKVSAFAKSFKLFRAVRRKSDARAVKTSVYPLFLSLFKKLRNKVYLYQRLTARAGNSAVFHELFYRVIFRQQTFNRPLCTRAYLPSIRIVAVKTPHRTALKENNKPYPRSIHRTKAFRRMYKSLHGISLLFYFA